VNRRPLVAGALATVAVATTGLLGACSAGQVAQTARVQPGVAGVNLDAPNGRRVYIRNAAVAYHGPNGYAKASTAPLSLWIFNDTEHAVTLTGVAAAVELAQTDASGKPVRHGADVVISAGDNAAGPCSVPRSLPPAAPPSVTAPSMSPSASPSKSSARASGSASASASPSASPSSSPSPSPSASVGSASIKVTVPAGGCVALTSHAAQVLQLTDLPDPLGNTNSVAAIFAFTSDDGASFTIGSKDKPAEIPVSTPDSPQPRASS
jgi:hypothetical protein